MLLKIHAISFQIRISFFSCVHCGTGFQDGIKSGGAGGRMKLVIWLTILIIFIFSNYHLLNTLLAQ